MLTGLVDVFGTLLGCSGGSVDFGRVLGLWWGEAGDLVDDCLHRIKNQTRAVVDLILGSGVLEVA